MVPHAVVSRVWQSGIANRVWLGECPPPIAGACPEAQGSFMKLLSYFARPALAGASFFALALIASPAPLHAQDDPVAARVNGTEVRQSDLAMAEEDLGGNIPQMTPEAKREDLITFVGDMLLVAKAAEAKKVADRDEF